MQELIEKTIERVAHRLKKFNEVEIDISDYESLSREEAEKKGIFLRDFGMEQWDWPQGVGIYSLHNIDDSSKAFIYVWAESEIAKGLPTKNVNTITPLLTLIEYPEYEALCLEWMQWIETEFPRTTEDGLQHDTSGTDKFTIKTHDGQIWIDTLFMTILFMAKMGKKYKNQKWLDEATYQLLLHAKYLLNTENNLFYHGWNFSDRSNFGHVHWCRGNCWFTLGLPIFLDIMGDELNQPTKQYISQLYKNQVEALMALRAEDKMWHTILDDPSSYTEISGSAGIIAGMYKGLKIGLLDTEKLVPFLNESIASLINNYIKEDGIVAGVSAGTPISAVKKDYMGIVQMPMVYGQATALLALNEAKRYIEESHTKVAANA